MFDRQVFKKFMAAMLVDHKNLKSQSSMGDIKAVCMEQNDPPPYGQDSYWSSRGGILNRGLKEFSLWFTTDPI